MTDDDTVAGRRSVPISALEHYAYCPRQAALIHIEAYFEANVDTVRGTLHTPLSTAPERATIGAATKCGDLCRCGALNLTCMASAMWSSSTMVQRRSSTSLVAGKLHNYRQLLLRAARDAAGDRREELRSLAARHADALAALATAADMDSLLGIEGRAARDYFQGLNLLAPGVATGRTWRPPRDPVNCLLSFGYGMLRVAVQGALEQVGLDPYLGFLHGVRSGKPALALDLMEEFRPLLVDRLVLTLINRGQLLPRHTETLPAGAVQLTDEGRKFMLEQWSASREREWPHTGLGRTVPAALLPLTQARLLARHLRGSIDGYLPWTVT